MASLNMDNADCSKTPDETSSHPLDPSDELNSVVFVNSTVAPQDVAKDSAHPTNSPSPTSSETLTVTTSTTTQAPLEKDTEHEVASEKDIDLEPKGSDTSSRQRSRSQEQVEEYLRLKRGEAEKEMEEAKKVGLPPSSPAGGEEEGL